MQPITLEQLKNRLASLIATYDEVEALKDFKEPDDPARAAFLKQLHIRISELGNVISLLEKS